VAVSKKLLISDANIIIDIVAGELVDGMFALEYEFGVPDLLYAEELEQQHSDIVDKGLLVIGLASESILAANNLFEQNNQLKVSVNDCIALSLAQQESCSLLTGDARLKQLAIVEGIQVRGTLWLVEQMIMANCVTIEQAEIAYVKMRNDGSRLPKADIKKQIKKFQNK
jgi:rRNA-processing protein FCF1